MGKLDNNINFYVIFIYKLLSNYYKTLISFINGILTLKKKKNLKTVYWCKSILNMPIDATKKKKKKTKNKKNKKIINMLSFCGSSLH